MKLDIGCLNQDFKKQGYIGIDNGSMDPKEIRPDVYANAEDLPFKDKTIDDVFSSSCVGLYTKDKALDEIARVLKDNGTFELWINQRFFEEVKDRLKELGFVEIERIDWDWGDDDPDYRLKFKLVR